MSEKLNAVRKGDTISSQDKCLKEESPQRQRVGMDRSPTEIWTAHVQNKILCTVQCIFRIDILGWEEMPWVGELGPRNPQSPAPPQAHSMAEQVCGGVPALRSIKSTSIIFRIASHGAKWGCYWCLTSERHFALLPHKWNTSTMPFCFARS